MILERLLRTGRLCPIAPEHGELTIGRDGRAECRVCGYVPCLCDGD